MTESFVIAGAIEITPKDSVLIPIFRSIEPLSNYRFVCETDSGYVASRFLKVATEQHLVLDLDETQIRSTWGVFSVGSKIPLMLRSAEGDISITCHEDLELPTEGPISYSLFSVLKSKAENIRTILKLLPPRSHASLRNWKRSQSFGVRSTPNAPTPKSKATFKMRSREDEFRHLIEEADLHQLFRSVIYTEPTSIFRSPHTEDLWVESWLRIYDDHSGEAVLTREEFEILIDAGMTYVESIPAVNENYFDVLYQLLIAPVHIPADKRHQLLQPIWFDLRNFAESKTPIEETQTDYLLSAIDALSLEIDIPAITDQLEPSSERLKRNLGIARSQLTRTLKVPDENPESPSEQFFLLLKDVIQRLPSSEKEILLFSNFFTESLIEATSINVRTAFKSSVFDAFSRQMRSKLASASRPELAELFYSSDDIR